MEPEAYNVQVKKKERGIKLEIGNIHADSLRDNESRPGIVSLKMPNGRMDGAQGNVLYLSSLCSHTDLTLLSSLQGGPKTGNHSFIYMNE